MAYPVRFTKPPSGVVAIRDEWATFRPVSVLCPWLGIDILGPVVPTLTGATLVRGGPGYVYRTLSGSDRIALATVLSLQQPTTWTVIALVRSTAGTSVTQVVANINYNGSTVPLMLSLGSGTYPGAAAFNGSWQKSGITTDIRGDSKWHVVAGTFGASGLVYYVDGKVDASASSTFTFSSYNTNVVTWSNYQSDGVPLQGDLAFGVAFASEMPAAGIARLSNNIWQVFTPVPYRRRFGPPATVAINRSYGYVMG